jgi:hypothetical protein
MSRWTGRPWGVETMTVREVVQKVLGISVNGGPSHFEKRGWFHVGETVAPCPECQHSTHGFRRPYTTRSGVTYHHWALVCVTCRKLLEPSDLDPDHRRELYASSSHRSTATSSTGQGGAHRNCQECGKAIAIEDFAGTPGISLCTACQKGDGRLEPAPSENSPRASTAAPIVEAEEEWRRECRKATARRAVRCGKCTHRIAVGAPILIHRRTGIVIHEKCPDAESWFYASGISDDDLIFHRATCAWVGHLHKPDMIVFYSRDEAIRSGHRPCKYCRP